MDWLPEDWIVASLALSVGFFIIVIAYNAATGKHELTDKKAELVAGIVLAVITIISIYIGSKLN